MPVSQLKDRERVQGKPLLDFRKLGSEGAAGIHC